MRRQTDRANPILATLKAKRGINQEIGFGSKIRKDEKSAAKIEKPENYLGPGYYEQKSCFGGGNNESQLAKHVNVQSKSCQNFLSSAPRWQEG